MEDVVQIEYETDDLCLYSNGEYAGLSIASSVKVTVYSDEDGDWWIDPSCTQIECWNKKDGYSINNTWRFLDCHNPVEYFMGQLIKALLDANHSDSIQEKINEALEEFRNSTPDEGYFKKGYF